MAIHLVSGGCGFVGRNMVKRLYNTTNDLILFIDNLSVGTHPSTWLEQPKSGDNQDIELYGSDSRLLFLQDDFRNFLRNITQDKDYLRKRYNIQYDAFADIFHFAAIVGGRATIDGDPMKVALDLSIDAEFFYWITRDKPARVLYPSSSAAYPVSLQTEANTIQLRESDIDFNNMGQPDMTYGWSKLTGEYLAKIAAQHYGIKIVCIRPFSGYGEDQDLTYPMPAIAQRLARREDPVEVWGTGLQGRDFVHIDDVLDCSLLAMDHIHDGTAINIGMGRLTSFIEIIETLAVIAEYQPTIKPLVDKPVGVFSRYCNMDFVHEKLGWKAKISLKEGLERMYQAALEREKKAQG